MISKIDAEKFDGSFDVAIRDAEGGWLVKYVRGRDSDNSVLIGERICTSTEDVLHFLSIELPLIKQYWNINQPKDCLTIRESIEISLKEEISPLLDQDKPPRRRFWRT